MRHHSQHHVSGLGVTGEAHVAAQEPHSLTGIRTHTNVDTHINEALPLYLERSLSFVPIPRTLILTALTDLLLQH